MKSESRTLTLIRHAKAEQGSKDTRDIDRPLKQKGEKQATRLGTWLKEQHFDPDMLWSSPAARTHMSARIILDCSNAPLSILNVRKKLYLADAKEMLKMIRDTPDEVRHLAIVGHNPGIADLIQILTSLKEAYIPTGTACCIDFNIPTWDKIKAGEGVIRYLVTPTMLKE
jgi:phosphohistidine phosphatase